MYSYKGYYGSVEYSHEDQIYHGRILGINDLICYEGESTEDLWESFKEAVIWYIKDKGEKNE